MSSDDPQLEVEKAAKCALESWRTSFFVTKFEELKKTSTEQHCDQISRKAEDGSFLRAFCVYEDLIEDVRPACWKLNACVF